MRIKINYSGVDINPYSVEIERTAEQTPITPEDFAKLALQESKFEQIKSIESCLIKERSAEAIVLTITLSNRSDLLNILPTELLSNISNHTSVNSYHVFTKRTSSLLNQKISNVKPVSVDNIFEQHSAEWLLIKHNQKLEKAISMLEGPKKIKELLTLINGWIQTDEGVDKFYRWINLCRDRFVALYNSLPQPQSPEHIALFALITRDVNALDLTQLNTVLKNINAAFPNVAASLNLTEKFLIYSKSGFKSELRTLLPTERTKLWVFKYFNLQGINLKSAEISKVYFEYANLEGADLELAVVSDSVFRSANLQNTNFNNTQLNSTDCRNAKFNGATMLYAKIGGSKLNGADMRGVIGVHTCFFNSYFDGITIADNVNFADVAIIRSNFFNKLNLSSAKETTFKYLEQKINQATPQSLLVIYEKNKQGILFLKPEIEFDYGTLFNEAILNQAKFLLSKEPNEELQNLIAMLEATSSPAMQPGVR